MPENSRTHAHKASKPRRRKHKIDQNAAEPRADSAYELAEKILEFDECNPGEPESEVIVPFHVWEHWIDLAGKAGFLPE